MAKSGRLGEIKDCETGTGQNEGHTHLSFATLCLQLRDLTVLS